MHLPASQNRGAAPKTGGDLATPTRAAAKRTNPGTLAAVLVLIATAFLAYRVVLARKGLETDEYLSLYTDSQPTAAQVLRVQLHFPISLDPPAYHLLSHATMDVLGPTRVALRLPAYFGFLLFEATLFVFVRRIAGWRSGLIAMLFPLITYSFFYATQGRPYGLLLGAYGLAMVCWQSATRARAAARTASLVGLACALVLAVTSHYFGVLVLVPIIAGELARTFTTRHVDRGVLAALAVGIASLGTVLPFKQAAAEYRLHYYSTSVSWHVIPQAYAALYLPHHWYPLNQQRIYLVVLVLGSVAVAAGLLLRWLRDVPLRHEYVAIAALWLLPVLGYVLAALVTHTADVRYVIPTLFAMVATLAIVVAPALRRPPVFVAAVVLLALLGFNRIENFRTVANLADARDLARQQLSPQVREALAARPAQPIYVQSLADFYDNVNDTADKTLAHRFSLVYSQQEELHWLHHDTNYLTARNMTHFAPLSIVPYSQLLASGDHPFVLNYRDGWDWLSRDLAARHIPMRKVGEMLGGELDELDLTAQPPMPSASSTIPPSLDRAHARGVN